MFHTDILLCLLGPEDGGNMFQKHRLTLKIKRRYAPEENTL
jgi:hypothetical protein